MQETPSRSRSFAGLSRWSRFWLVYDGAYLALWGGRKFGLVSDRVIGAVGAPIFINWVLAATRWVVTGSPLPRSLRD